MHTYRFYFLITLFGSGLSTLAWLNLPTKHTTAQLVFPEWDWQKIQHIQIQKLNKKWTLTHKNNTWWLAEENIAANHLKIQQLQALSNLVWTRQWSLSAKRLQAFGLDQARWSIQFANKTLSFGDNAPFSDQRCYAQIEQQIGLIKPCPQILFATKYQNWLSSYPLLRTEKIISLQIGNCQAQLQQGFWNWSQDRSQDDLQMWLQAWQYLEAHQLISRKSTEQPSHNSVPVSIQGQQRSYHFGLVLIDNDEALLWADNWAYALSARQSQDIYPVWCRIQTKNGQQ